VHVAFVLMKETLVWKPFRMTRYFGLVLFIPCILNQFILHNAKKCTLSDNIQGEYRRLICIVLIYFRTLNCIYLICNIYTFTEQDPYVIECMVRQSFNIHRSKTRQAMYI
jgi:hypothetical protein